LNLKCPGDGTPIKKGNKKSAEKCCLRHSRNSPIYFKAKVSTSKGRNHIDPVTLLHTNVKLKKCESEGVNFEAKIKEGIAGEGRRSSHQTCVSVKWWTALSDEWRPV
jgi:hypothetical protein